MSVLENFKNIPRSPYVGAIGLKCNFFSSSNLQQSPWRKRKKRGPVAPPTGDRPLSPPQGRQAPVARWGGDRVPCVNCFRSFLFSKIHYSDAFFSYVVLYLSDYYATFDI